MFYTYNQNNSGGNFQYDRKAGITHFVIIEAENSASADYKAEAIGLYFDGDGDCPCCGDRWYRTWKDAGRPVPSIYGKPVDRYDLDHAWMKPGREIAVHYANGKIKWSGGKCYKKTCA